MSATAGHMILAPSNAVSDQVQRFFPGCRAQVKLTGLPIDPERFDCTALDAQDRAELMRELTGSDDGPLLL